MWFRVCLSSAPCFSTPLTTARRTPDKLGRLTQKQKDINFYFALHLRNCVRGFLSSDWLGLSDSPGAIPHFLKKLLTKGIGCGIIVPTYEIGRIKPSERPSKRRVLTSGGFYDKNGDKGKTCFFLTFCFSAEASATGGLK